MSQISQIKKIYHAAIYVRLSKEDGAVASHEKTESNSIANQKSLIRDFLENKNDIEVVQEYVDDGFSGSNFERPAFQMMLEDIKKGKIDCVVTKDLSRFGREYIDSGMYIERLFPAMGVRFIAINDGIDSGEAKSQSDEIIIPFKNLINDAYCRDISIKIRSHLEIKRKQGDVITAFVPYGYKKNDKDKHKLEIDVYAANVVKDIFRMKLHGKSQDAIACELNSSGILPPAEYKASTGSNYQTCFKTKEKSEWTSVMVRRILTNEVYIGNLVQGKQTTPNHKVKKTIIKEKCEWVRIEKNHEPIITDRDFEVVQRLLAMDTRTSPDREEVYPLSGVVTCGGCGIPMVRKTSKVGGKTYAYYLCATHKDSKQCSSHRISTDKLEEVVLELLQTHIDNMIDLKRILSFSHQRKLMLDHIQKLPELKDCNIMEFSDDGYSGADFSRPNFVKMMDLVKAGKIQVIVTKDYSRLGRDYLEVGNYMECIFPVLQVRYISVNDNYDSANSFGSTGGMSVALKNLVNALYCKDASKKVRAAKAVLAKQGKYIAAFAPFGYQKSEDDKHMLVPDPVTAPVVQLIFELAIKGMKYTEIANYLNNNGYDSIFEYYQKIGVKRCYERDIGEHMWSASTVMEILYNEVYIGSVINNKTADNIDTGHQVVQRDKEDWIIVENCHEPLVSVEDFKLAHKMIARREVTKRKPNGKWRKSYIRCGICGKGLYKYGNKSSYRCHNGHVSRIRGEELEATLLDIARNMALAQLQEFELKTDGGNCLDNLEREIESLKKSKAHYAKLKFEIYDDYTKTNITRDQMAKKTAEVKQKIAEIESLITEKQETLDMQKDLFLDAKQEQLTKLSKLDEFDEEVIRYLIDYVLVYDNEHIEIRWNFDDFQAG